MYMIFEGGDGSGKDTQRDLLARYLLTNHDTVSLCLNEPDNTNPVGQLLRELLKSGKLPETHAALFLADRIALQVTQILPALQQGRPVLCSRSFLSTLVYQQENWPLDWLFKIHQELLAKPNVIFILDLNAEEGLERAQKRPGHMEYYEKLEVQVRNRERYLALTKDFRLKPLLAPGGRVIVIDARGTPEEVHQRVIASLKGDRSHE